MSLISIVLSTDQEIKIDAGDLVSNYVDIRLGVEIPAGQRANNFNNLSFGYTIYKAREVLKTNQWPLSFSKYVQSDRVFLETDRVYWQAGWPIRLEAWFIESGKKYTGYSEFTVPTVSDFN
jgi:hypothetical protein